MIEIMLALATGIFVGILFSLLKLPTPAPPVFSGIMGIFGIYMGTYIYKEIVSHFFS